MEARINFINGGEIIVEKNGDCYITPEKPEFPDPLGRVVVESADGEKRYEDAQLVECASIDGRYWFALIEVPEDEKMRKRIAELEETNEMLAECVLEMSEIVYA